MKFVQFTVKVPVPSGRWLRFSVRSLLLLILFVALACLSWRVYRGGQYARLRQQLEESKLARDNVLQKWKHANSLRTSDQSAINDEAALRAEYFKQRSAVDGALRRLARFEGRPENDSPSAR
jgi:hypothetical protein